MGASVSQYVASCFKFALRGLGYLIAVGAVVSMWQWLDEATSSWAQQYLVEWAVIAGIGFALSLFMCALALLLAARVSLAVSLPALALCFAALFFAPAVVSAFITLFTPYGTWLHTSVLKAWAAGGVAVLVGVQCFAHLRGSMRGVRALETPA